MGPDTTRLTPDLGAANSKGARTHQNVYVRAAYIYFSGRGSQPDSVSQTPLQLGVATRPSLARM